MEEEAVATTETVRAAFQAMHDDLARREEELIAELKLKNEENKKRLHEYESDSKDGPDKKKPRLLLTIPWYTLKTPPAETLGKMCTLERHLRAMSIPTPQGLHVRSASYNSAEVGWDLVGGAEDAKVAYQLSTKRSGENGVEMCSGTLANMSSVKGLAPDTEYDIRVRAGCCGTWGPWSEAVRVRTPQKRESVKYAGSGWKDCPACVAAERAYATSSCGRVATYSPAGTSYCTIIGDTALSVGSGVWTWGVKILRSKNGNGGAIWVGVAPEDIDQNGSENYEHGWYFWCFDSSLWSGPPHNYSDYAGYGDGNSVAEGHVVGVEVDMAMGTISFSVDGSDFSVAYDGVPVEKPLVPVVILGFGGDSVELIKN